MLCSVLVISTAILFVMYSIDLLPYQNYYNYCGHNIIISLLVNCSDVINIVMTVSQYNRYLKEANLLNTLETALLIKKMIDHNGHSILLMTLHTSSGGLFSRLRNYI